MVIPIDAEWPNRQGWVEALNVFAMLIEVCALEISHLHFLKHFQHGIIRPRKNNCWFPVTRPTLILTPDPTKFFSFFQQQKLQAGGVGNKQ
jgi:hypothetical protein